MNRGKLLIIAVASVLLCSHAHLAMAADDGPPPSEQRGPKRDGGGGPGGERPGLGRFSPPTDEEWQQIEAFAAENSPRRLTRLQQMRETQDPALRAVQNFLVTRYRALQAMKQHDPDLYARRLEGLKVEDKVFGAVEDGAGAADASPDQKQALREDVRLLVTMNLEEREERINRMAEFLEAQRLKLLEDKGREEELTEEKMAEIERDGVRSLLPDRPSHRHHDKDGKRGERGERGEKGDRGDLRGPPPGPDGPPPGQP
ncbi:MAG TPA: hypothetical protein VGN72_17695 [Tepidisphaeraceae bacterium]|jgi:hypothetical protein|nr:hypothetical protein [Tepidisphaeraceae bacterium]